MDQFQDNVRVVTNGCNYVTLELTRLHNMLKVRERELEGKIHCVHAIIHRRKECVVHVILMMHIHVQRIECTCTLYM